MLPKSSGNLPDSLFIYVFPPCFVMFTPEIWAIIIIIKNGRIEVFIFSWTLQSGQFLIYCLGRGRQNWLKAPFFPWIQICPQFCRVTIFLNFCMHSWEIQRKHILFCVSMFWILKIQWIFTAGNMNPINMLFFIYHKILEGRLTCTSVFKNWRPRWQSNLLFVNL